jgi:hypothetical protein
MFDMVKAIHEALHIESTWAFVLVVSLVFALMSGGVAWVVDKGYKNSLRAHSEAAVPQAHTSDSPPPPISAPSPPPTKAPGTSPPISTPAADEKPPTLASLFTSDFPSALKLTDNNTTVQKPSGESLKIKAQIYADFSARTQFVGFYIPTFPDTYGVCLGLAGSVGSVIERLSKSVSVSGGYRDERNDLKELTFSRRVMLYHEDFLSIPQKAEIIKAYTALGLDVNFRGTDYLGDQVIAWRQKHDKQK